jgi:hypothetical protein
MMERQRLLCVICGAVICGAGKHCDPDRRGHWHLLIVTGNSSHSTDQRRAAQAAQRHVPAFVHV